MTTLDVPEIEVAFVASNRILINRIERFNQLYQKICFIFILKARCTLTDFRPSKRRLSAAAE